jgi:hypothetical protein
MTSPAWKTLAAPLPPAGRALLEGHAQGGLLLFVGPQAFRWTGDGFELFADHPFGEDGYVEIFFGYFDPQREVWMFLGFTDEGLLVVPAGGGEKEIETIPVEGVVTWNGRPFAFFHPRRGEPWLVLPGEEGALLFALRKNEIVKLSASEENFQSVAWDASCERLIGIDVQGRVFASEGSAWTRVGEGRQDGQIAWHARLGALVQLAAEDDEHMRLSCWDGACWTPIEPASRLSAFRNGFALGVDAGRDQVVVFGGQDFDKGGDTTNEWFAATAGGDFRSGLSPAFLPQGRYNTACNMLVATCEAGAYTLPLEACGVGAGELPVLPVGEMKERKAPRSVRRKAAVLKRKRKAEAILPALPKVPERFRLLAILPAHPKALPLQRASGLAVFFDPEDYEGWDLGGPSTRVLLLPPGRPPQGLIHDPRKGGLVPFALSVFEEIDPAREEEFDTLPGNARELSFATKVGGYPRLIQDEIRGKCKKCKKALRFAAQLSSDTYEFGDVGRLYVLVCPDGCMAAAAVQCH